MHGEFKRVYFLNLFVLLQNTNLLYFKWLDLNAGNKNGSHYGVLCV